MNAIVRLLLPLAFASSAIPVATAKTPAGETPPTADALQKAGVVMLAGEWHDASRDGRTILWRAYLPAKSDKPTPVVIVSHGLGGSRDGLGYLGETLAAHGVAALHLQHAGSDSSVWRDKTPAEIQPAMRRAANSKNAIARAEDVSFAITRLEIESKLDAASPFAGKIDASKVGVAGHSFGAHTALSIAGFKAPHALATSRKDSRIKAALALSPPVPVVDSDAAFDEIGIPVFIFTGTEDKTPFDGKKSPADRQKNFRHLTKAPAWMIVFEGGDHMVYSGRAPSGSSGLTTKYAEWRACVGDMAVALFRSTLLDDKTAAGKLTRDAVVKRVGDLGVVSEKH